jgi:hypothetical protein
LSELSLSLDQRQGSQVFSIQIEQIKRDKDTRRFSEEQILEDRPALSIDACNLAIEHGLFNVHVFRDPSGEFSKPSKCVPITRDQLAFTVSDAG